MLTIHVWPKRLKEFLLAHPLYKSPPKTAAYSSLPDIALAKSGPNSIRLLLDRDREPILVVKIYQARPTLTEQS